MKAKLIFGGYIIAAVLLLLFSYTQVDLNLTLSQVNMWQSIQKAFQYIGYYLRPLATALYVAILVLLFTMYGALLAHTKKHPTDFKTLWKLIFIVTGILVFSYPAAFSYDFFNYMFTAKTVLVYRQNPYAVTPLQFAAIDPWTNFMRWTHLPSAYTPLWIGMSLVPYVAGLGYFILVLFAMKFMIAGFYLLAAFALSKATKSAHALAFFALNPLILIESLVSGHNDIVLVAFVLVAVYLYKRDAYGSWFFLGLSIAAKLMTLVLVPIFWLKKNTTWMLIAMVLGLGVVLLRREFLPWYWVWILPFIALTIERFKLTKAATIVSLGLLVSYAPFVYFGEYSTVEQLWKTSLIWGSVGLGSLMFLFGI
jgi:hypothetical protein